MTENQFLATVEKIKGHGFYRVSYITEDYNIFGARLVTTIAPYESISWASSNPVTQAEALEKLLETVESEVA